MFKKILIVDDHASVNHGIVQTLLRETKIPQIEHTQYCDDAYLKFQKASQDKRPFDLLIVDLTFKEDHRKDKFKTGIDLIETLRSKQPQLKVIVYSVEDRPVKIKSLVTKHHINGFVSKSRNGLKELLDAIHTVWNNNTYISKEIGIDLRKNDLFEIEDFDIMLLEKLAKGITQEQITEHLMANNIKPNSLSSIEKKINRLKIHFKSKNTIHLVAKAKDLGLI